MTITVEDLIRGIRARLREQLAPTDAELRWVAAELGLRAEQCTQEEARVIYQLAAEAAWRWNTAELVERHPIMRPIL